MYFGGSHGYCSEWKVELWSHGQMAARLTIGNCGITERWGGRKRWELIPAVTGQTIEGRAMTNEQSLRCVDAYDMGLKTAPTKPIEDLL